MNEVDQNLDPETEQMLSALQSAVRNCLDRKQRLGQYAVIWEDGKVQYLSPEQIRQHLGSEYFTTRDALF